MTCFETGIKYLPILFEGFLARYRSFCYHRKQCFRWNAQVKSGIKIDDGKTLLIFCIISRFLRVQEPLKVLSTVSMLLYSRCKWNAA